METTIMTIMGVKMMTIMEVTIMTIMGMKMMTIMETTIMTIMETTIMTIMEATIMTIMGVTMMTMRETTTITQTESGVNVPGAAGGEPKRGLRRNQLQISETVNFVIVREKPARHPSTGGTDSAVTLAVTSHRFRTAEESAAPPQRKPESLGESSEERKARQNASRGWQEYWWIISNIAEES